jgi:hypothetical protein
MTSVKSIPGFRLSTPTQAALQIVFTEMARGPCDTASLRAALDLVCRDAKSQDMDRPHVVAALRSAFDRARRPVERRPADWDREFRRSLGGCLDEYFS